MNKTDPSISYTENRQNSLSPWQRASASITGRRKSGHHKRSAQGEGEKQYMCQKRKVWRRRGELTECVSVFGHGGFLQGYLANDALVTL